MKKVIGLMMALVLLALLAACGGSVAGTSGDAAPHGSQAQAGSEGKTAVAGAKKVAMLLSGPINDAGWNESAYKGLMSAKEKLGVETAYSESLQQPDFETVLRDYADKGYELIICHGFQFSDAVRAVAPEFTDSMFCVVNGDSFQEPNMASFRFNTPQTGFLSGAVAGLITESNTVAMIGGTRMPHIEDSLKGFEAGAQYVNPDAKVLSGFTEDSKDLAKAKEMAMAYGEQGADVFTANADQSGLGVIEAAGSMGAYHVGYIEDQYEVAPDTIFVSVIQSVQFMVETIIEMGIEGDLSPEVHLMGVAEGAIYLSDFHGNDSKLPEGGKEKLDEIFQQLKDGTLKEQGVLPKSIFEG